MNRGQIQELKRSERAAFERVHAMARAEPYDETRYHRALIEWKSARLALRSLGIAIPRDPEGIDSRRPEREVKKAADQ
ncbi:MAG: hypothetical protein ABI613_05750 [Gemmatimonadota bacterium]